MPEWSFWLIVVVFGGYFAYFVTSEIAKVARVARRERRLTDEARRRAVRDE